MKKIENPTPEILKNRKAVFDWAKRNLEKARENARKSYYKYRHLILHHYSNSTMECACCGEDIYEFLTIDHIKNDGAKELKLNGFNPRKQRSIKFYKWLIDNNFPKGLQVLCYNCNCGKERNKGICPHVQRRHVY